MIPRLDALARALDLSEVPEALPAQFRSRINIDPSTGCWLWTGAQSGPGYGSVVHEGRNTTPHRAVYRILRGEIPEGLELDHLCRNRLCCNPEHLEAVTHKENLHRSPHFVNGGWDWVRDPSKRTRGTHCRKGHERTSENAYIGKNGQWKCRVCLREWKAERRARRPARVESLNNADRLPPPNLEERARLRVDAGTADGAPASVLQAMQAPTDRAVHTGERDCERCEGKGRIANERDGWHEPATVECPECAETGRYLCSACCEHPAIIDYHWSGIPGGEMVDRICQACSELEPYRGGLR